MVRWLLLAWMVGCGGNTRAVDARPDAQPADAGPADARGPDTDPAPRDSGHRDAALPAARFLALGDSYTIGQGVPPRDRWPTQLAASHAGVGAPIIIAQTGWTTADLDAAIDARGPVGPFGLVTLLIGVNDQFQGQPLESYRGRFAALLGRATRFAGGPCRVVVLSIPDYSVTPFGRRGDAARIAMEIDAFNAAAAAEARAAGVAWVDITPISRRAADTPGLLAPDGLHPSGRMYADWVSAARPAVDAALRCPAP